MSTESQTDVLPAFNAEGKPVRIIYDEGYRLEFDLSRQIISIADGSFAAWTARAEEELLPTPAGATSSSFVPAGLLMQKAKQFDDGLYAAVELAAQNGAGYLEGKKALLRSLTAALAKGPPTKAAAVVAGAAVLGGQDLMLPQALDTAVRLERAAFRANPRRSKPLGFYTWSGDLTAIFRQDRLLQEELSGARGVNAVAKALAADGAARATYERYLALVARLTNPWEDPDVRKLLAAGRLASAHESFRVLPPSTSHESTLVMRLFGNQPIPEGFDLMNELIARIRSGEIDLAPRESSGWYDYQTYALETLVRPDRADEAPRLRLDLEYNSWLTDLFKGALALARETHVKQMKEMVAGAALDRGSRPRKRIHVNLALSAEPLITFYRRRAEGYRFLHSALREAFGARALEQMHRQAADAPSEQTLEAELSQVTDLFDGAAALTSRQLGMPSTGVPGKSGNGQERSIAAFLRWAGGLAGDPDLARDSRMMVPVFYDVVRGLTKAWVFLGWSRRVAYFGVAERPGVTVYDQRGRQIEDASVDVVWKGRLEDLLYPVVTEVYVGRLLDRDEFRRLCDTRRTHSAILAQLR